ncbi:DUF4190 domain-containing protein [Streptomyces mirabilis]|nr:DUF4190 domain-containing protein [Streptomyces mirabilis]
MSDDAQAPQVPQDAAATPWASPDRSAPPPTQIDMPSAAGPEDAIPGGNPQPVSRPAAPRRRRRRTAPRAEPLGPACGPGASHAPGAPRPLGAQPADGRRPPGTGTPAIPSPTPSPRPSPGTTLRVSRRRTLAPPAARPRRAGSPPPIAPEGPGQVPYGYGYGYPAYPTPGPGYPGAAGYGWPMMPPAPSNGMGTAGLVLGIISAVVFCLWPIAIILGILAVIFGVLGRRRARRGEANNPGQALAGIICGAVGIALGIAMIVVFFVLPDNSGNSDPFSGDDGYSTSLVVPHLG